MSALHTDAESDGPSTHKLGGSRFLDWDWRIVGITALFGALAEPDWIEGLASGDWTSAGRSLAEAELFGLLVFLFAALLFRRAPALSRPIALTLAVILGCFAARAIELPPYVGSFGADFPGGEPSYWTLVWFLARNSMMIWGTLAAAWYFLQRSTERQAALRASVLARRMLETQLVEARLQVMQAQVEPHFLFNTLAHVKRLYKTDPLLAKRMLDRFCEYMRAALPQMRDAVATLGSEVELAEAFLDVQKIRMGERLVIEIAVPRSERQQPFPPMMLVSLVENAIKHGLNPLPEGGVVRVSAEWSQQALRVMVADSGRGFSTSRGTGVGLANIRSRLAALYGPAARFTLAPNVPRGIRATIEIPARPVVAQAGAD
jgi:hypothetical protein